MDGDLGEAVRVPGLRPHDEPFAGLAASVAVVCGDGHRGNALSARDSEGDSTRDRREMRTAWESGTKVLGELVGTVRASLRGLVHNRRQAWPMTQFRPGIASRSGSGSKPTVLPTEKDSGRGPPR